MSTVTAQSPEVELVPIGKLKPNQKNPRLIPQEAIDHVAAAIEQFGFTNPIRAQPDGTILAGHTRYFASQKLGMPAVPVIFDDRDDDEAMKLMISDNRTAEWSTWDKRQLALLTRDLAAAEGLAPDDLIGMSSPYIAGFDNDEIETMNLMADANFGEDGADIPGMSDEFDAPDVDDMVTLTFMVPKRKAVACREACELALKTMGVQ